MTLPTAPHRRYDPLADAWVLVSAGRAQRPWQGQVERADLAPAMPYDASCYLCPGNARAGGARNPDYTTTFTFENDFAALRPDVVQEGAASHPLLRAVTEPGTCRVLCFSPRHDLPLALMSLAQLRSVVDLWTDQYADLAERWAWVQLFENRGEGMGASNPHPHGQVWATASLPNVAVTEDAAQRRHLAAEGAPLLVAYAELEAARRERVVAANDAWVAVVPFWAAWPFEALVLPRRPVARLTELRDAERDALADVLCGLLARYDNLFEAPFPYSMGWHGAPGVGGDAPHWQLHAHVYPPMLRSAAVRKFMVGYELLANVQRDLTAEEAAARLRDVRAEHHLART